ncbi:MAG: major tail protein [Bacteroidales bacterium]
MGITHSAPVGVENLVYALLTDEDIPAYDTVKSMAPLINIKVSPKINSESLYADNRKIEIVSSLGDIDVEIEQQDLPLEVQADILGHTLDEAKGVLAYHSNDIAPYLALGFKIKKANGKYRYVWLLKGKFEEYSEEANTTEDKAKFTTPKLKAAFMPRIDGNWKYTADEDSGTVPETFLSTVYSPTIDLVAPTVTTSPLDGASGVLGTANIVFTFDKAIQPSCITPANFFIMKADGTAVAAALSIGTDNTVVTLDPTALLGAGSYIAVATTNVKSIAGVSLSTNCVVNFTV